MASKRTKPYALSVPMEGTLGSGEGAFCITGCKTECYTSGLTCSFIVMDVCGRGAAAFCHRKWREVQMAFFSSRNPNFYYCYYFITVISPWVIFFYMRRCGLSIEEIDFSHLDREHRKCFPWLSATLCCLHFSCCVNYVGLWAPYQTWAPTTQLLLQGEAVISPKGQQCN